jgi:hypothetical protein
MIDAVAQANEQIAELRVPLHTIATLTDIPLSEVSRILSRKINSTARVLKIAAAVRDLRRLAETAAPLPLDFKKSVKLKAVIGQIERGEMKVLVTDVIEEAKGLQQHQ